MPGHGKRERRAFANYLSIGDRYSAQANFDSENTIGGRFRVNRAHKRSAAFLPTVIYRQQWQKGDSLLNFKFRRSGSARARRLSPKFEITSPAERKHGVCVLTVDLYDTIVDTEKG